MIVSKESRKTIATARTPTSATRICISLASNPDSEKKIHQAGRGLQSRSAVAAPHVMKMARFVSVLFVVAVGVTACGGGGASGDPPRTKRAVFLSAARARPARADGA